MSVDIIDSGKVRRERERLGLTQAELASRAGLPRERVSYVENGRVVALDTLMRLYLALDRAR